VLALVPIKAFAQAKQRLSGLLAPGERAALSAAMAGDVLSALARTAGITRIVVCAGDAAALPLAREFAAETILEEALATTGLNNVVSALARRFAAEGEPGMLVLHSDLPGVQAADIAELAATLAHSDVVITPDGQELGSNMLGWRLASGFVPRYGTRSFVRHCQQAENKGLLLKVCPLASARLDIDNPVDLQAFLAMANTGNLGRTRGFLHTSGIADRLSLLGTTFLPRGVTLDASL